MESKGEGKRGKNREQRLRNELWRACGQFLGNRGEGMEGTGKGDVVFGVVW